MTLADAATVCPVLIGLAVAAILGWLAWHLVHDPTTPFDGDDDRDAR